jgi:hypothetical protein
MPSFAIGERHAHRKHLLSRKRLLPTMGSPSPLSAVFAFNWLALI